MKFGTCIFLIFFGVVSWAERESENPESLESSGDKAEHFLVHEEREGLATVSLPPGLNRSKIRFFPYVENGVVTVSPRKTESLALPNPRISINLQKIRSYTLESNDAEVRAMLEQVLKSYYIAYQADFLKVTKIDARFSPLEPMLSVALYDVQKMSFDKVLAIERRLIAFKSALDAEAARFFAHNYNLVLTVENLQKSLQEIKKQKQTGTYPDGVGLSQKAQQKNSFLNLSPKSIEIFIFLSLILSCVSIGLAVSDRGPKR